MFIKGDKKREKNSRIEISNTLACNKRKIQISIMKTKIEQNFLISYLYKIQVQKKKFKLMRKHCSYILLCV